MAGEVGEVGALSDDWLLALPKAEVHLHLEGCVPGAIVERAAARAGVAGVTPSTITSLTQLLSSLDRTCGLIESPQDLADIAYATAERAARSGTRHIDVIVNPTHWRHFTGRLQVMVAALDRGLTTAEGDGHASATLCVSLKRTQTHQEATRLVEQLVAEAHPRVSALSIDGNEAGGSHNERFIEAFALAAAGGLRRCAHAGESSGAQSVREAIELLGAERIDHGIRCVEDPALVAHVAALGIPLDICPTSNVVLGVVDTLEAHPVVALKGAGVAFSINTDDPLLYGIDLLGEYRRCATTFGWGEQDVGAIARTSLTSCFASAARRSALLEELDNFLDTPPGGSPTPPVTGSP